MQVERSTSVDSGARVSNTWLTYPKVGDNVPKGMLIPYKLPDFRTLGEKFRRFGRGLRAISLLVW